MAATHQEKRVRFFNAVDLVNQLEREKFREGRQSGQAIVLGGCGDPR
jgi:hypothetical protein